MVTTHALDFPSVHIKSSTRFDSLAPQSKGRKEPLAKAHKILLEYRNPMTLVGIVKGAKRDGEETAITSLREMLNYEIDMATIIIIGKSTTHTVNGKLVTPRGYDLTS